MKSSTQVFFLVFCLAAFAAACVPGRAKVTDPTDMRAYIESAHRARPESQTNEGSLWVSNNHSNLFGDPKARYVDDMLTIVVAENTQAVSSADASNSKKTSASTGFDHLFGAEKGIKELPTMVSGNGSSSYEGKGSTTRQTTLQTTLTARVTDVLPNGYLVVEGMREIRVNNENQSVYLTGVVRPEDVSANNSVLSSSVAQMSVWVQGRGVVSQPLKPGWLYRILSGILPF
jgi:flagellar L-ring protein FlgH